MPETTGVSFIDRESQVRQTALRVTTALSVFLASLLFFLIVPLLPRELMVILSIGLGALAYKAATPALMLLLLLALPGYCYQFDSSLPAASSLPISLVIGMFITLLIGWVLASEKGEPLGALAGATAVILMLTPVYYLALPMMIGVTLFRTKGIKTRAATILLTFGILYYPFLAVNSGLSGGDFIPIFDRIMFQGQPPIPVTSLNEILVRMGQIVDVSNNLNAFPYLANLADYWPLSLNQRLIPAGILFCLLTSAAIAIAGGTLFLFRWIEKREVGSRYLPYTAKALSLLVGVLIFISLADILAQPLSILNTPSIPLLLMGTLIVGMLWTLIEIWLRKQDYVIHMRHHLADQARDIRTQTDFLADRLSRTKAVCQRIDSSREEALIQMCSQELNFTEQAVTEMPLTDIEHKAALFQDLHNQLEEAIPEAHGQLCHYYDEQRQKYNDSLILAQKYGFTVGGNLPGIDFPHLTSMAYEEILNLQISLNGLYKTSAESLARDMEKFEETLFLEVDPDFKRTGIHIARNYFARECYDDALQEFLQELGDIEHLLLDSLPSLDQEVMETADKLKAIVADVLVPTAVNTGDLRNVDQYHEIIAKIAGLHSGPIENPTLPDMMRTVDKVSALGEMMADLSSKLGEKLGELEKSIREKSPSGYSWGLDPGIRDRMIELSRTFRKPPHPVNINDRLALLKTGPVAIDPASRAIKDYSIAHELLINYANIECQIEQKLQETGSVGIDDLPLKREYARHYLKLYCLQHSGGIYIEADTGRLTSKPETPVVSRNARRKWQQILNK
jgi:hypothetical protein